MPPADADRPSDDQRQKFLRPLGTGLQQAIAREQASNGRVTRRRLNRVEYQNTMHDLLGIHRDLTRLLPEDQAAFGFDKISTALTLSRTHLERYLDAADIAIDDALGLGAKQNYSPPFRLPADKVIHEHNHQFRLPNRDVALFPAKNNPFATAQVEGRYAFRCRFRAQQADGVPVYLRTFVGNFNSEAAGLAAANIAHFEASKEFREIEFVAWLEPGKCFYFVPDGMPAWPNYQKETDPHHGVVVEWVEVEGPLDAKVWPPATRGKLVGDIDLEKGTFDDARTALLRFAPRAFRRPVTEQELAPYIAVVRGELDQGAKFAEALKAGLKAILVSPRFLFLEEQPGWLDDHALACRLSYFLWSTMPDEELMAIAARGELTKNRDVYRAQVKRMLADKRAKAFTRDFVGQWLDLRRIDATSPDPLLYPEFNPLLQESMVAETHAFFDEVLHNNLSVTNFIDSDFAMLNGPLATLYGIPDVSGIAIRKVPLKLEWKRGGVLTHASVLKVTANGTTTSPVIRGFWVADRLLGHTTPPPPPDVPAVDPDIRGAKSIREQLAKHRKDAACASCHAKTEPLGFALESYDVIGGWRNRYRIAPEKGTTPDTVKVFFNLEEKPVAVGLPVEAADVLADGRRFTDLAGLKPMLKENPKAIAQGLAKKLLAYATGRNPSFPDEDALNAIVQRTAAEGYGLRSLVIAISESDSFRRK
jgi:hypothetical protein